MDFKEKRIKEFMEQASSDVIQMFKDTGSIRSVTRILLQVEQTEEFQEFELDIDDYLSDSESKDKLTENIKNICRGFSDTTLLSPICVMMITEAWMVKSDAVDFDPSKPPSQQNSKEEICLINCEVKSKGTQVRAYKMLRDTNTLNLLLDDFNENTGQNFSSRFSGFFS